MKLSDKLDKLMDDLSDVKSDVTDIKIEQAKQGVILERNTLDLEKHIRRTEIAEERLDSLTIQVEKSETQRKTIITVVAAVGSAVATVITFIIDFVKG